LPREPAASVAITTIVPYTEAETFSRRATQQEFASARRDPAPAMDAVRAARYGRPDPMLVWILIRIAVIAAAFGITAWLLDGMDMSGGFWGYIWVAILFGIVNAIVGTFLRLLTLPLILLTLGLFAIIVNALLLEIVDWMTDSLTIDEFWWTSIWAAIILAIVMVLLDFLVRVFTVRHEESRPAVTS
jgi:putative membrane protein